MNITQVTKEPEYTTMKHVSMDYMRTRVGLVPDWEYVTSGVMYFLKCACLCAYVCMYVCVCVRD